MTNEEIYRKERNKHENFKVFNPSIDDLYNEDAPIYSAMDLARQDEASKYQQKLSEAEAENKKLFKLAVESEAKDKRIKELAAEIERLKEELKQSQIRMAEDCGERLKETAKEYERQLKSSPSHDAVGKAELRGKFEQEFMGNWDLGLTNSDEESFLDKCVEISLTLLQSAKAETAKSDAVDKIKSGNSLREILPNEQLEIEIIIEDYRSGKIKKGDAQAKLHYILSNMKS